MASELPAITFKAEKAISGTKACLGTREDGSHGFDLEE